VNQPVRAAVVDDDGWHSGVGSVGGGGNGDAPQLIRTGDGMNVVNGKP